MFLLYDGRAKTGNTDNALVMVCARSEEEVREDSKTFSGYDAIWFEYDTDADGKTLINEKARPDLEIPA
jgi:hypothetical protein